MSSNYNGIAREAREHLDRAVAIFAYIDGQEDPGNGDVAIEDMRADFNRNVAIVRGAIEMLREAAVEGRAEELSAEGTVQ